MSQKVEDPPWVLLRSKWKHEVSSSLMMPRQTRVCTTYYKVVIYSPFPGTLLVVQGLWEYPTYLSGGLLMRSLQGPVLPGA